MTLTTADIQSMKRESWTYNFHEFDTENKLLEISYIVGNKESYDFKTYSIGQFEDWIQGEYCEKGEDVVWVTPKPTSPMYEPMPYAVEMWDFIKENEEELVIEFFNKFK